MYNLTMGNELYKKTLSQNLKTIRRTHGLSGSDVAKILNTSQAKISYIEHGKGVLSAEDIAILSRRLNIPITTFFAGLSEDADITGVKNITQQLAEYGAAFLIKPSGVTLKQTPFEIVFINSLPYIEDDRLHKGLCAALIIHSSTNEINIDRIFSVIGNNPFLINKAYELSVLCLTVINNLDKKKFKQAKRATSQINKLLITSQGLLKSSGQNPLVNESNIDIADFTAFVEDCLNVKK